MVQAQSVCYHLFVLFSMHLFDRKINIPTHIILCLPWHILWHKECCTALHWIIVRELNGCHICLAFYHFHFPLSRSENAIVGVTYIIDQDNISLLFFVWVNVLAHFWQSVQLSSFCVCYVNSCQLKLWPHNLRMTQYYTNNSNIFTWKVGHNHLCLA